MYNFLNPASCLQEKLPTLKIRQPVPDRLQVERPKLFEEIRQFCDSTEFPSQYMVVVGPRGSGKTTAVQLALQDRAGVVSVVMRPGVSFEDALLTQLGVPEAKRPKGFDLPDQLKRTMDASKAALGGKDMVLVGEFDTNLTKDDIKSVSTYIKELSTDARTCRGILVLSDANAAFALAPDSKRQSFLWVDELEPAEFHIYLDTHGLFKVNSPGDDNAVARERIRTMLSSRPQELQAVLDQVPRYLDKARQVLVSAAEVELKDRQADLQVKIAELNKPIPVTERFDAANPVVTRALNLYIEKCIQDAEHSVTALLATGGQPYIRLTQALLQASDGRIRSIQAMDEFKMPAPVDAAELIKKHHALLYHFPTHTYRIYSPAHRIAFERWFKEHPQPSKK